MSYKVLPTKNFVKDFDKLDDKLRDRVKKKINEVSENPTRYKHLRYDAIGSCRLWVGKLRVIYTYDTQKQELYPEKIVFGHKY